MRRVTCHPNRPYCAKGLCKNCYYFTPEQQQKKSEYAHERSQNIKVEVLTHYGKHGKLKCCWSNCTISDVDMLTLDHIENDGGKHLGNSGRRLTGTLLYSWAKANGYPDIFQTLCGGHQFKKAIQKARKDREKKICRSNLKNKERGDILLKE